MRGSLRKASGRAGRFPFDPSCPLTLVICSARGLAILVSISNGAFTCDVGLKRCKAMPTVLRRTATPTGVVPIAVDILTTPTFNPGQQIDQTSITFGATGDGDSLPFCQPVDVKSVGVPDLVCVFDPQLTGLRWGQRWRRPRNLLEQWTSIGFVSRAGSSNRSLRSPMERIVSPVTHWGSSRRGANQATTEATQQPIG